MIAVTVFTSWLGCAFVLFQVRKVLAADFARFVLFSTLLSEVTNRAALRTYQYVEGSEVFSDFVADVTDNQLFFRPESFGEPPTRSVPVSPAGCCSRICSSFESRFLFLVLSFLLRL